VEIEQGGENQQCLVNNNQLFEQEGLRTRDEEDIVVVSKGDFEVKILNNKPSAITLLLFF
jgi:hypothetical protein